MRPIDPRAKPARGLLHQTRSFEHFELTRFEPSADLSDYVEHHWLILWDLTGKPAYRQQNLSHPTQHLVLNPQERTGIFGMATGAFTYVLERSGRVLGTKFRPGAFHSFYRRPVSALTDGAVPIGAVLPARDDVLIERDAALVSVAGLAEAAGMSARSLQRLFGAYIGVGPKWVIDRYRMIEAVETLNRGEALNLADLAARLGYFDQAHFSKAFQSLTGEAPGQYRNG